MGQFYTDIETNGFNPEKNDIITIQYQSIDNKGFSGGDLVILKSWDSSEKHIVTEFHKILNLENNWAYIPIMTNSLFDFNFLFEKFNKYNLPCPPLSKYLYDKPIIDIKHMLVMMNGMNFKGAGLDKMTNKESSGKMVPVWYENKEYDKIIKYVNQEADSFLEFFQKCMSKLPNLL